MGDQEMGRRNNQRLVTHRENLYRGRLLISYGYICILSKLGCKIDNITSNWL